MTATLTAENAGAVLTSPVTLSRSEDGTTGGNAVGNNLDLLARARALLWAAREKGVAARDAKRMRDEAIGLLRENSVIGVLDREAVGVLIGEEGKPLDPATVTRYGRWSEPDGRFAENPFPKPSDYIGGRAPVWAIDRAPELVAWKASLPGRGAGGGRPWHKERAGSN